MVLSPRMKWKINRYGKTVEDRLEKIRNFFKSVTYKQKMCPACRALVDRNDKVCPFCGENTSAAPRGGASRVLSKVLPEHARYSTILLTVNLILFGLTLAGSARGANGEFDFGSLLGGIDSRTLVRLGAKYGPLIAMGEWWRFITPVFLHGGIIHLAFNTWVMLDLAPAVEQIYGSHKFLVLYVVTGAAGFVVSYFWHPYGISVGASGALCGLIGAMIAYGHRNRTRLGDSVKSMYLRWAIYILVFGVLVSGIDNAAHLGGLAAGFLFGMIVDDIPLLTKESIVFWKILQTLTVLLVVFAFVMIGLRHGY
jgi:rhomboid protease GluP